MMLEWYAMVMLFTSWFICIHGLDELYITLTSERPTGCSDGSIRLRGGAVAYQGTVEICVEGTWGTVCDRSWDGSDATVVCRQLGYPYLGECITPVYFQQDLDIKLLPTYQGAIAYSNARYGSGSGPIWLDYLLCNGSEANLLNCAHRGIGITSSICDHFDDAGVQCPSKCITVPSCTIKPELTLIPWNSISSSHPPCLLWWWWSSSCGWVSSKGREGGNLLPQPVGNSLWWLI